MMRSNMSARVITIFCIVALSSAKLQEEQNKKETTKEIDNKNNNNASTTQIGVRYSGLFGN